MLFNQSNLPSAAKAASILGAHAARLKSCPFKAMSFVSEFHQSECALEERRGDQQCADADAEENQKIELNGLKAAVFENDSLEAVNRIGEWIDDSKGLHPCREGSGGIHGTGGIKQEEIENAEHGAGCEWVLDAHHQQKHHPVEGDRCYQNHAKHFKQHLGMKDEDRKS